MFYSKIEYDDFGSPQKHYFITQGDSQLISVSTQTGETNSTDNVSSCCFKIGKEEVCGGKHTCLFTKELTKDDDAFVLELKSNDTKKIPPDKYVYTFRFEFVDGSVKTLQWFLTILPTVL